MPLPTLTITKEERAATIELSERDIALSDSSTVFALDISAAKIEIEFSIADFNVLMETLN